ncbi:MAG TPA: GAF domain-containing protein [Pseudonocardia sp.]
MDEEVCAVRSGVDLGRHARLLAQVYDALLSGDQPPARPRDLVERSWRRVRRHGVSPDLGDPPGPVSPGEVEQRRAASPLSKVLPELRASLTSVADDARHVMVITDADGVLLWREGAPSVRHRADKLGFTEGANWSEGTVGTNAIGTALAEASPVQIFSAEHFVRRQHAWTCTACPVHDPRTGQLLGVVDVSGPAETVHPTTVALVCTAVKLAESSLWRLHEGRLEALRAVGAPLLATVRGPGLVVDEHGWVAAVTGMPALDRVASPRADQPLTVHGIGLCEPEPVPGGWLLRAAGDEDGGHAPGRMRMRLELDSRPVRVVVEGTNVWLHPLPTRQAELLLLLARAGTRGLNAAELSMALYGDGAHLVTVRAELSRLRRTLGGLLLARPYRIASGVRVQLPDLRRSGFVERSTAPGVQALAHLAG